MLEDAAGIRRVVLACGTVDLRKGIDKSFKHRIFFDWDVRGRAASGRKGPFYFGSVSEFRDGGAI